MRSQITDEQKARSRYRESPQGNAYVPTFQGNTRGGGVETNPGVTNSLSQQNGYHRISSSLSSERFTPSGTSPRSARPGEQRTTSTLRLAPFEGWFVLILLAVALYCIVASIMAAQWVAHSEWLLFSPVAGLLVGLIVAKMPYLPQFILHLGACLVGHWLSVWLTSVFAFQVPWTLVLGDLRAAFTGQLVGLGPSGSELIFFFYLSFLCFFLGYFGSWLVYRAHLPWLVVLVYISIMLVNLNYGKQDMSFLTIIMAAALLLLVARTQLAIQVAQWKHEGLHTDRQWLDSMKRRGMQIASVIAVITLILGWVLPIQAQNNDGKMFWERVNTAWVNMMNGRFSWQDLKTLITAGDQTNFFGDQLTIAETVRLPTGEVLRYQITNAQNTPHYLEGFTFNAFDGRTWTSSLDAARARAYQANDLLPEDIPGQGPGEEHIRVSITQPPNGPKNYIFAPASPRVFSVPTIVYSDGTAGVGMWAQQRPLSAQQIYEAAFVTTTIAANASNSIPPLFAGKADLRAYGKLPEQYFQIPTNISPQVQQQAFAWTSRAADSYTALKLLEKRLSDSAVFTYSLDNQPVPADTDVISWLLKTKRGYCTHYATAMAMMARMLNIPTRMVNGFSQGRYDAASGQWVVNGDDAHSWVQAFFPNYGWISFDPTPGFAPSALPAQQAAQNPLPTPTAVAATPTVAAQPTSPTLPENGSNNASSSSGPSGGNAGLWIVVTLCGLLLAIALLLVAVLRYWWFNLYTASPLVSAIYWRFCRLASFFGLAPRTWQTPYEYSRMIGQHFPAHAHSFRRLTDLFVREHWGGPQKVGRGLQEAEAKDLTPSLPSLLFSFLLNKFRRKSSP